jgi:hypothetical protein
VSDPQPKIDELAGLATMGVAKRERIKMLLPRHAADTIHWSTCQAFPTLNARFGLIEKGPSDEMNTENRKILPRRRKLK